MVHFGIPLLGHGTGGFIEGTTTDTGQTITGQTGDLSSSFTSAATIFSNILSGIGLPASQTETQIGEAFTLQSQNFTSKINELITIREQDISKINENFRNFAISKDVQNEQPGATPQTITESLKFGLTDLQATLGGSGLIIGIVIVGFLILKK